MEKFNDGVIDLSQFRKKKEEEAVEPFFTDPVIITLGDPQNPELQVNYMLSINLVKEGRQYLALESLQKDDRGEIAIVEATITDGEFTGVKAIETDEEYEELVEIMTKALHTQAEMTAKEEESLDDH